MKIKTALAAALLAVAPALALAGENCGWSHTSEQAMSCAEGLVWDQATGTCVEQVNS